MERSSFFEVADEAAQVHSVSLTSERTTPGPSLFLLSSTALGEASRTELAPSPALASQYNGRALDLAVATLLLVLVFPLMCLCALAVLGTSRGSLLFRHPRIGRNGEVFECLKFRTMVLNADHTIEDLLSKSPQHRDQWEALHKLDRDPRVTPVGAFLRRYCLDELPQLFNVLAGQMSMVGPRPIVAAETEKFGANFALYCSVKPGLTGLWQISGRHLLSYSQRVELDAIYVRSRTLSMDVLILLKTAPVVLCGKNG